MLLAEFDGDRQRLVPAVELNPTIRTGTIGNRLRNAMHCWKTSLR